MSFLNSVLKAFVGDKSKKDVRELQPILDQIKSFETTMEGLTLDEIRAKTTEFKARIKADCQELSDKISELTEQVHISTDIDKNEDIYAEIDRLKEESYKISEATLNDILPEAFAVVKETTKRFVANETLSVTATEFDRKLSGEKEYVSLDGDKAIWLNSWD
ncbi:MAG: preprotein translocase subunit SecA, partial [Maribacter sp.]|nr:preprotein translocase subunit SecA [Maribacter sp.]